MVRFAGLPRFAAAFLILLAWSVGAGAQELRLPPDGESATVVTQPVAPTSDVARAVRFGDRPAALLPLYASFVTLQALDLHSTRAALAHNGVEANPAIRGIAGNFVGLAAVKAAGTAGIIFASEKLRTKNKMAAIGLMIAANSAMTWVVQHNYRIAR